MIEKEITLAGKKYIIGFKEAGSDHTCSECHVLSKTLLSTKSLYHKLYIKRMNTDPRERAIGTILEYEAQSKQTKELAEANWR